MGECILVLALGSAWLSAQSPASEKPSLMLGTWKFNPAKSQFRGPAPTTITTIEQSDDSVKLTTDTITPQGQVSHIEWIGKFDGKDYPIKGTPNADTRAFKRVDDYTYERTDKKDNRVVQSERIIIAADGNSRTTYTTLTDPKGQTVHVTAFFDRQH